MNHFRFITGNGFFLRFTPCYFRCGVGCTQHGFFCKSRLCFNRLHGSCLFRNRVFRHIPAKLRASALCTEFSSRPRCSAICTDENGWFFHNLIGTAFRAEFAAGTYPAAGGTFYPGLFLRDNFRTTAFRTEVSLCPFFSAIRALDH